VSTEPDTRPFTSAELARFLEQLELDLRPPRSPGIEARPRCLVATEPATMLGMGKPVPFAVPEPRRVSGSAQLESWAPPIAAARVAHAAPTAAPRFFPDPFRSADPAVGSRSVRLRLGLALGVLLLSGLVACLVSTPSRARLAHAAHRGPPPLPAAPARSPHPSLLAVAVAGSPDSSARPAPGRVSAAASRSAAALRDAASSPRAAPADENDTPLAEPDDTPETRLDALRRVPGDAQQVPIGRPMARREAVDLLLAGRTRAALAAYRALPPALLAEPALVQVVRQLERELRECSQLAGSPCGS